MGGVSLRQIYVALRLFTVTTLLKLLLAIPYCCPIKMAQQSQSASWQQSKQKSRSWFDKIGTSVNKVSNKLGAEAFWPTSLEKESDKAARILRSFCIDGFMTDAPQASVQAQHGHKHDKRLDHIPPEARSSVVARPLS